MRLWKGPHRNFTIMTDLFQPSPFFLFVIFFKTAVYIPLCMVLGLLMSFYSQAKPRLFALAITFICLIIIYAQNPLFISIKDSNPFNLIHTISNLANGWFLPFFISFLFLTLISLFKFSNSILETCFLIIFILTFIMFLLTT